MSSYAIDQKYFTEPIRVNENSWGTQEEKDQVNSISGASQFSWAFLNMEAGRLTAINVDEVV